MSNPQPQGVACFIFHPTFCQFQSGVAYKSVIYEKACNRNKIRSYIKKATKNNIMSNESFWKTMKELLTRKGNFSSDFINIEKHGELMGNVIW